MSKELTLSRLAIGTTVLLAVFVSLHFACLHYYPKPELDPWGLSDFYPLSVFKSRLPALWVFAPLVMAAGLAWYAYKVLSEHQRGLFWLLGMAFALVLLSNLFHGFQFGLDYPTAGWGEGGSEYWQDAQASQGPLWFLRHFHDLQPYLLVHAKTHPAGPVLLYWLLGAMLVKPWAVSCGIALLALGLGLWSLDRLLTRVFGARQPELLLLWALLPGIQIYGLAVMDAVLAGVMCAALVEFLDDDRPGSAWRCAVWLFLASALSFGALFLGPVLLGLLLLRKRGWGRAGLIVGLVLAAWGLVYAATGYDQWRAFRTASALENEGGFLLKANPRGYLWYRLGAVAEIAFFFTPFLLLLLPRGLTALRGRSPEAWQLFWLGLGSLAAMLLSGAMKIGEAARLCLFLLPYLLLPVAAAWQALSGQWRQRLLALVLAQSLLMQLFGFYQW